MEPAYFLIAILGCADGSVACTPVMTVPTRYESEAACTAAAPGVLMNNTNFDYPSLLAQCRPAAPRSEAETKQGRSRTPSRKA
ncbi:MAG TPA: hypothetical protein VFI88_01870 [Sphingomicrobium sp.]|jgi:hypothetical protein|nr:hypothetical protein [Sphingomicrobium sp.]